MHMIHLKSNDGTRSTHTTDLVLSIRAVMVLFRWASLAGASVKTKISEEGGAAVRASWQSQMGQEKVLFIRNAPKKVDKQKLI